MYTLEIDGKPIAVINADEATARDLFTCDGFKEDIRAMTNEGRPLWNGTSALVVRAASEAESDEFDAAIAEDDGTGDFEEDPRHQANAAQDDADEDEDEEDEADIVFLVEIDGDEELDA